MFADIFASMETRTPLVHCITNYVTVNDVANMILACGGSPIMADDAAEVEEITSICSALVINIGTLNSRTIESMLLAGKRANALGHPVILDPVGAGASSLRTETTFRLLKDVKFSVIRGNISEIKTVAMGAGNTQGVDADAADAVTEENLSETVSFAKRLSQKTGAVIAITGAIDIITDGEETAAYAAANPEHPAKAAAAAVSAEGLAGELARARMKQENGGTSSLRTYLIDAMSRMDAQTWRKGAKVAVFEG